MLNTKKIESIMAESKITKATLCKNINIGRTTFDAFLKGSDIRISTLEAIAKYLNVQIGFLFDEDISRDLKSIKGLCENKRVCMTGETEAVSICERNLHRCVRENRVASKDLEKIKVSIDVFFDEEIRLLFSNTQKHSTHSFQGTNSGTIQIHDNRGCGAQTATSELERENAELKCKLIAAQERIIELMDRR